jgi:hypothetical protein
MAKAVLIAQASPTSAETEAEFVDWYANTHIPQVREAVPSIVEVSRYRVIDFENPDAIRYITTYEMDSDDVATAAAQLGAAATGGKLDFTPSMDVTSNPGAVLWAVGV